MTWSSNRYSPDLPRGSNNRSQSNASSGLALGQSTLDFRSSHSTAKRRARAFAILGTSTQAGGNLYSDVSNASQRYWSDLGASLALSQFSRLSTIVLSAQILSGQG